MDARDPLRVRLTAEPHSVGQARHAVEAHLRAAGLDGHLLADVIIAVNEAASNVVAHAYRDADLPGEFALDLDRDGDELQVTVRDEGCGPLPNPNSEGIGMGIPLMSSLSETFEIKGNPDFGTEVRMTFRLA
jgi:serine/threonine-protein kinase RsbW/stage II sporulation protein AB (anti-sigma F factor)